ncbi:SpoIIE family protein phosphatase [Streptomyces sp. NPDC051940]|uniref:SpoIIE family protein phosphatase n=1 Tax=Streptomyces sp. NPDC051940 TaxID=3155675 RepID=UPI00343CC075
MRPVEVLSAVSTGVWSWSSATGRVLLDGEAARLLGVGEGDGEGAGEGDAGQDEPATITDADARSRIHGLDYVELSGIAALAYTEGTLAEAVVRVVGTDGAVLRRIRVRLQIGGAPGQLAAEGTVQEVIETSVGLGESERQLSREAFLLNAGRALAEAPSTDAVLRVAAALAMPGFTPAGQAVFTIENQHLSVIGHHGYWTGGVPFDQLPISSSTPACAAARTGSPVYLPSAAEFRRRYPVGWDHAEKQAMQSWAYLPLTAQGEVIGVWMLAFREATAFTPEERAVLSTVARMLAQALARAYAHDVERDWAAGLQRSMMPGEIPPIPGLAVAARYVPTSAGLRIGGDWYDVIDLPTGRVAFVIGDVQGHDVRAARVMGQLRIAIRAYASEGHNPRMVLVRASHFLSRLNEGESDERFATCLYLEADPATGTLVVARAGHLDPTLTLGDGTMLIHPTEGGVPLGILPDPDYPLTEHVLVPGETMMLCTDGLAENGGHDLYTGQARLQEAFQDTVGQDLQAVADALVDSVTGPESYLRPGPHADRREDDIALVLLRAAAVPARTVRASARRLQVVVPRTEQERIADTRAKLRGMLYDWEPAEQVDAATLALSELIANVMIHTVGDATVSADLTGPRGQRVLRLSVADPAAALPHRRHPGELASSGRGVLLLDALADAWGVEPRGAGKAVWCEFHEAAAR